MASFSIGEALGSGFGLIRRHPLAVLAWGIVYFAITLLPFVLMWGLIGGDIMEAVRNPPVTGAGDPTAEMMALSSKMQLVQPLSILCSLLAAGVLNAAIFRAVLRPRDKGFLYMKLGKDEFWQALISLCIAILLFIAFLAVALVGGIVGGIVWFVGDAAGGAVVQGVGISLVVLAVVAAMIWIGLRFSMAAPATFATGSFQLFESWTLTKGQGARLFGLALVLFVVIIVMYIVLIAIIGIVAAIMGVSIGLNEDAFRSFFEQGPETVMMTLIPLFVIMALISALISGAYYAILMAPWASVYRQLVPATSAAEEF
jgi:hypothetical protein